MKIVSVLLTITIVIMMTVSFNDSIISQNNLSHFYEDTDYVEGEIIVMFKSGIDADVFKKNYESINLSIKEALVAEMNIYLFQYDITKSEPVDALLSVMRNDNVAIAQFNHRFKERVVPNDTRFAEQWDKNNTGQSGGTPDADIDAPEAWNISTGGVTAQGDTIVLAIVDGGQQVTHTDLDTWRNHGEITANGIDDDNNGYIDDIYGWHAGNNNGTIPSNSHGTHCAGIAGAKGNNSLGVAGVNWKVKTMPVAYGSATEQNVIKAYGYVLKQRKIYNQTNGAQGAFVVATNSSFGIDFGQPVNYPLWCAFYDSLGMAGILSAGAGPNRNINIDTEGDIPTTCPSNFMIAVTNTTRTDAKNSGAGYGPIHMDLGAPGTSILSTVPTNNYSSLTGTSMATPQVTGAIGLLHAGAHNSLIQLMKNDPDSAALLFKQIILSTVDTIPSMNPVTVSKGRLNIHKMLVKGSTVSSGVTLNLTAIIEGFWNGSLMVLDTARIYLRNTSSPYAITDSAKVYLNSSGNVVASFPNTGSTIKYLIVKHRNSVETWSASGVAFTAGDTTGYDFTVSASQAFGNNLKNKLSKFCIYNGDVNQDEIVDAADNSLIDNDAYIFAAGYAKTDLTGDNVVDINDISIADNNAFNFVEVVRP